MTGWSDITVTLFSLPPRPLCRSFPSNSFGILIPLGIIRDGVYNAVRDPDVIRRRRKEEESPLLPTIPGHGKN